MAPQREWFEKDYYQLLGVAPNASAKEITKRYRQLARELHPDANPNDPASEDRFKEVSAAYEVLHDEKKRAEYDEARTLAASGYGFGPSGGQARAGGGHGGGYGPGAGAYGADLNDLLSNLFGGAGGPGRSGPAGTGGVRGPGPQRGQDVEADLHLDFRSAALGVTTSVNLTSEVACSSCHGSGANPGTTPQGCPTCGGRGFIDDNQGFFSFSRPCHTCAGRGSIITDPCVRCSGSGVEVRPREVKVRIPPGVADNQRIRLKARGAPGRNGGPPGDLFIRAHIDADKVFGRSGDDLTLSVPITFPEAALGTELTVPTLDGDPVTLRIPAGTASGRTFRVKNRGLITAQGRGNLLVTVEIVVPATLSREQRKAVEALAELTPESPRAHLGV